LLFLKILKNGLAYRPTLKEAYWSSGAGMAKRRSIRFALIFCFFCIKTKEKEIIIMILLL
jgi:hypothetical protein